MTAKDITVPTISVVISTYNNAESLAVTVAQLLAQDVANPDRVEVILVNNNSSDHTQDVMDNIRPDRIAFTCLFEPRQGLSYARNSGIAAARGEYILFTDDDADLSPQWLSRYLHRVDTLDADCIFGRISVIWDQDKPWWYDDRYLGYFAAINYGDDDIQVVDKNRPFYGKNFCVRKRIFDEFGGFDPALGRKGNDLVGGEEIQVYYRLVECGKRIFYCPDVPVGHRLKPREYTADNIRRQYVASAKAIVLIAKTQPGKRLLGKPLGVLELSLRELLVSLYYAVFFQLRSDKREAFYHRLRIARAINVIWFWVKT